MKSFSIAISAALLASPALAHVAIKPPSGDKWLTPNSSTAPAGCKLLASDKGFPSEEEVKKEFPSIFTKMKATEGPDYWLQATSVADVQKAVKFAAKKNIRINVITSGHDFHGREDQRSGLRVDLASLVEPTVFSNTWSCGKSLKARSASGREVKRTIACPINKPGVAGEIPQRETDYVFFEHIEGETSDCAQLIQKRHGPDGDDDHPKMSRRQDAKVTFDTSKPWEWGQKTGFTFPAAARVVDGYNVIPNNGKVAYARVSGGMFNERLFMQADKSGYMSMGAQHGGVSVLGGWLQAGGHTPFAHKTGMGVDNVVELEVVTADGKFVKASECSNQDLFWALRGGGGGTYGIVVGGTVKVHPTFPVTVTRFFVNSTSNYDPKLFNSVAHFLQRGTDLREKYGLQGYFYVYPNGFHSVLHLPAEQAKLDNAKKVTAEIMGEMEKIAGTKHIEPTFYEHKSYKEWYVAEMGSEDMEGSGMRFHSDRDGSFGDAPSAEDIMMNPMRAIPYKTKDPAPLRKRAVAAPQVAISVPRSQPMGRTYLDSRLLSNASVNAVKTEALGKVLLDVFPRIVSNHVRGFLFGGGEMSKAPKDAMGLNPAWRDITFHYIINALPGSTRNDYNIRKLDTIFPDAGAYVNEANPDEPNWKVKYWGSHYAKLESIKNKYDPNHLFWCSPCVGADYFTYDDERICKNKAYPETGKRSPPTYANAKSKTGIASLPGQAGIPNPLMPIIVDYQKTGKIPQKMPASGFFKIAMGQGGSAGGRWSLGDPTVPKGAAASANAAAAPTGAQSPGVQAAAAAPPMAGGHAGHDM